MAKIVISGASNCPYYAKVELLADNLERNLPNFKIHKIVVNPEDWQDFSSSLKEKHQWTNQNCSLKSPIVWRELVDRGGKSKLIGGANEFLEFANCYYNFNSDSPQFQPAKLSSVDFQKIAENNVRFKREQDEYNSYVKSLSSPCRVLLTGSNSHHAVSIMYQLASQIAGGSILGEKIEVSLSLCCDDQFIFEDADEESSEIIDRFPRKKSEETEVFSDSLEGVKMELQDCAHVLLRRIHVTKSLSQTLSKDLSLIVVLHSIQRERVQAGEESNEHAFEYAESEQDWLRMNVLYFEKLGKLFEKNCHEECKILIVGYDELDPINLQLAAIYSQFTELKTYNCIGLVRHWENKAAAILGQHMKVEGRNVKDILIWGNIGAEPVSFKKEKKKPDNQQAKANSADNKKMLKRRYLFVDPSQSRVYEYDGAIIGPDWFSLPVEAKVIWNKPWLNKSMPVEWTGRGLAEFPSTTLISPMAISQAAASFLSEWILGRKSNEIHSLCIVSKGWYNVPKGTVFCFPVILNPPGYWSVIEDIDVSENNYNKIQITIEEIERQRQIGFAEIFEEPVEEKSDAEILEEFLNENFSSQSDVILQLLMSSESFSVNQISQKLADSETFKQEISELLKKSQEPLNEEPKKDVNENPVSEQAAQQEQSSNEEVVQQETSEDNPDAID